MPTTAIRVEELSKLYLLQHRRERYVALRDVMTSAAARASRRVVSLFSGNGVPKANDGTEEFWALRGVSFEIAEGDRVGVIGRNGAGKSTLLKILSRITEPTEGRVTMRGRVASLLEVGTGFHPELSGRENIFLNGAILGMGRLEIRQKFDEIVAFAEVERFLDTPVKRYSSGMYVRLAFAVAAHLEPEILLIDEVLAVGDIAFQTKCLGKMNAVAREGRTVVFVSHNMAAVSQLCTKGIVLDGGRAELKESVSAAVSSYLAGSTSTGTERLEFQGTPGKPQFSSISLGTSSIRFGENLALDLSIVAPARGEVGVEVEIHDERGMPLIYASTAPMAGVLLTVQPEVENRFRLQMGPMNLGTGEYSMFFWLLKPWAENYHIVREPLRFRVDFSDPCGSGFDFKQSYARGATTVPMRVDSVGT